MRSIRLEKANEMSSLVTLRGSGKNVFPPFEVLGTKSESKNAPHGVYLQGGLINSFTEMSTDFTCLDIENSSLQPINNQQFPISVNPIGGSFHIDLPIQHDKLTNPSSITVDLHMTVNKRDGNGASIPVVLGDGIVPTSGFYPLRSLNAKINQHYVNSDLQTRSADISLFRNMEILSEYNADYSFGNAKQIYNKYNNFHGIHQTLAESKEGTFNAYTITAGKATAAKPVLDEEKCDTVKKAFLHFQQRNIQKMLNGGFMVKLEIDFGFLNKTRLTPFVIESAILELTFLKPLSVLAREKDCTSNAIDSVHFMIKNVYIQHQSVIPSEKLWKGMVNLSEASTDLKKSDMILPSWPVQQRVHYDSIPATAGSSSLLNHIRGREIPERLFLFFRRKGNVDKSSSNNLYLDFPEITSIKIASSSISSHFLNQTLTSPFADKVKGVKDSVAYIAKNEFEESLIDIHLNQISLNNLKIGKGLPLLEDAVLAYTSKFALNGHFFGGINLVTAVANEVNIQSPVNEGNFTIEVNFGNPLAEEYIFDLCGSSNAIQTLNIDKSFETSRLLRGTSSPTAVEIIQSASR